MRDKTLLVVGSPTIPVAVVACPANRNSVAANEFSIIEMRAHLKLPTTHEARGHDFVLRHEAVPPKGSFLGPLECVIAASCS